MKYAIIAAGQGSRLADEGVSAPKPLVNVGGECLIDRLIRIFMAQEATEICVICNEQMPQVAEQLRQMQLSMVNYPFSKNRRPVPCIPSTNCHRCWAANPLC